MAMPEYVDGVLEIRRIVNDESEDYPEEKLERIGFKVWYRELRCMTPPEQSFQQIAWK